MAQVINTNVAALFAGAALNKSANALQTAQSRLASGLRINSAKDDASGLAAATSYDTQIRTTNVQIRNASDAISTAQTYDGYLGQITENLQRMSEIVAGVPAGNAETTALAAENTRINALVLAGAPTIGTTIATIAADLTAVGNARAAFGATMAAKSSEVATLQIAAVNLSAAYSRIMDTDYAAETTSMTRNNILQQAGTAVLAQANQTPNTVLSLLR
ncbi:MAG: flagellin [Rhodocyclales bacterium]|nr:flagellin [Rhodocyclales bacterium]